MKKVVRTSVTIPKELLPYIDREAKAQGRNRSSYLVGLVLADLKRLPKDELKLTHDPVDSIG